MSEIKCPCGLRKHMEDEDCRRTLCCECCPMQNGERKEVSLEDIVDVDAQTKANNEAMRKVMDFIVGERKDHE